MCWACWGKESAVPQSPACTSQLTVSISPVALISQHTHNLSLVVLWHWLEQWWLSTCLGAVQSGCMCNLDVHRKAKFSIMMWSHAIKTLVYSLLCLYFGQLIVYIIKCVEDFQEVFCLILYLRASCKCLLLSVEKYLPIEGFFVCIWPCRKQMLVSRSALREPRWLQALYTALVCIL